MTALGSSSSASLACSQITITASAGSEERSAFFCSVVFLPSAADADFFWLPFILGDEDCLAGRGSCERSGKTIAAHRRSRIMYLLGEDDMIASPSNYHIT